MTLTTTLILLNSDVWQCTIHCQTHKISHVVNVRSSGKFGKQLKFGTKIVLVVYAINSSNLLHFWTYALLWQFFVNKLIDIWHCVVCVSIMLLCRVKISKTAINFMPIMTSHTNCSELRSTRFKWRRRLVASAAISNFLLVYCWLCTSSKLLWLPNSNEYVRIVGMHDIGHYSAH